jgi:mono/diheme cytochrome c family protein
MNRIAILLSAALLASAAVAQAGAPSPAAREGELVARRTCAYCHLTPDDQAPPPLIGQKTPSLRQIANDPKATAQSLRRFITTTHWDEATLPMTMPDPRLLDQEYGEVVAYVLSLRTAPGAAPPPAPVARDLRLEAGEELALRRCAFCHVVTSDPRYRPSLQKPIISFAAIADDPKTTAQSLRGFIATTHWDQRTLPMTMPNQELSPAETRDVIGYILSLRKKG